MTPQQREAMLDVALPPEVRDSAWHVDLISKMMDGLASRGFSISLASVRDHTDCASGCGGKGECPGGSSCCMEHRTMSAGWRSESRARLADRDKPLAPDEGIASAQAEWEGDLYAIAERGLDALDAVLALHRPYDDEMACRACTQSIPVAWPCPTVRAIESGTDG